MFLEDIGRFSDEMTESERERFEAYVTSEDGQELLVDLADRAVRTRSQTAMAALAILFANPVTEDFDEGFRGEAPHRIEAVSDQTIVARLALYLWYQRSHPATLFLIEDNNIENIPELRSLGYSADVWLEVLDDLLSRRILGRDPSSSPRAANLKWARTVRFTKKAELYARLFARARKAMGYPPVGEAK